MVTGAVSYTEIGPNRVFYEVLGRGQPVVLLHGLAGSGRWWRKNIDALGAKFCLYLIDLIGFGAGRRQRFALDHAAQILLQWADAAGLDRFSMVGHSMGGLIAADMAAAAPNRIDRLVLVDAAAVPVNLNYLTGALGLLRAARYMSFDFLPALAFDTLRAGPVTMLSAINQMMRADISRRLERIQADTLIIWGQEDRILPLPVAEQLRSLMPRARFVMVPGAGHVTMWDRPEVFNELVIEFLQGDEDGC